MGIHAAQLVSCTGIEILPGRKVIPVFTEQFQVCRIDIADTPGQAFLEPAGECGFLDQLFSFLGCKLIFRGEYKRSKVCIAGHADAVIVVHKGMEQLMAD